MKILSLIFLLFLTHTSLFSWTSNYGTDAPANSSVDLDVDGNFSLLFGGVSNRVIGDMNATGDSVLTTTINNTYNAFLTSAYKLTDANTTFNAHSDPRKRNSSSATLNLPDYVEGRHITFAALFWQGSLHENLGAGLTTAQVDTAVAGWNQVTFKTPDGNSHSLTASLSTKNTTSKTYHYAWKDNDSYRWNYSAFVDVTTLVQNTYSDTNNTFTVGNILTTTGKDFADKVYFKHEPDTNGLWPSTDLYMGYYGGWSLVVVYNLDQTTASAHQEETLKSVSIYDGYENFAIWVQTDPLLVSINVDGFLTPKSGAVDSKLLIFGGGADKGITGDVLEIYNHNTLQYDTLSNSLNPISGQFNSSYTYLGTAMAGDTFKNGVDLDIFDVSNQMGNNETNTTINFGVKQLGGSADQIYPQVIAFSTQLYEPQFCYDYAYSQNGVDFTDHNQTGDPRIIGSISNDPIDVKIFIRNEENSDVIAQGMLLNILDINTSQATYISGTTQVTYPGELLKTDISESVLDSNDSYIKNIPLGDVDSLEHVYTYYQLSPVSSVSDIDIPINGRVDYNLSIDIGAAEPLIIPYNLYLNSSLPLCSGAGSNYNVTDGMFNIVHDNYSDGSLSSGYKYNLPTQVTSRPANFRLISLDPDNPDTLKDINATVAIQLMNISGFGTPEAICEENANAIGERIWITMINSNNTSFNGQDIIDNILINNPDAAIEYYQNATRNAAFRIYYPPLQEANATGLIEPLGDKFKLINFPYTATDPCAYPVTATTYNPANGKPQGEHTYTRVPEACGSSGTGNGTGMTQHELNACMECIFGGMIDHFCSRDNFAIRPEAFLMHIDDQNQTSPASQSRLTTNYSGIDGAVAPELNLASGYNYNLEVNATNHINNTSSPGYTQNLNIGTNYMWEPRTITAANAAANCNDDNNQSASISFLNGVADINSSVYQVGEYQLNILDTAWTAVDSDSNYMGHHTGSYFQSGADCVTNSTVVQNESSYALNGCNISSNHTNNEATLKYNDYDVKFHPYQFDVTTTLTLSTTNIAPPATKPFIYMADIDQDENMSVHLNTTVTARGQNSATSLSNYVTGCYAEPLNITIGKSATINNNIQYKYRLHDLNSTGDIIIANDINGSIAQGNLTASPTITTTNSFFQKDLNGIIITRTNLNFDRDVNATVNPEDINFTVLSVDDNNTMFSADLNNNKTIDGNTTINQNILHYYGRTAGKKTTIICDPSVANCTSGGTEPEVFIYYEVFCNGTINGNTCNHALLPTDVGGNTQQKVDRRWFINLNHNIANYGDLNNSVDSVNNTYVTLPSGVTHSNNYTVNSQHSYAVSNGLPYTAEMDDTVPRWLVYDENNASATLNNHTVIFRPRTEWTGEHEADSKTKTDRIRRVNRRTMW